MHDQTAMLDDLREAIGDMPESVVIAHSGGVRSTIEQCAISDITHENRMIEDEGIMVQADTQVTYATADAKKSARTGDKVFRDTIAYNVLRATESRGRISTTLELKEAR